MWGTLLKFIAVVFLNQRLNALKNQFSDLRQGVADYTEDRAQQLKQDFLIETERLATSVVGVLLAFAMMIFTGLLGLMWLFALLWDHPQRTLLLGLIMLIPATLGLLAFLKVRSLWRAKPLFADSLSLISQDWQSFRQEVAPHADSAPSPLQPDPLNPTPQSSQ